jgi:hypothetical protein
VTENGRFDLLAGGHRNGRTWRHPGHSRSRNERPCPSVCRPHGTLQPAVQILHGLGPGQPPEGKPDGGDGNEGGQMIILAIMAALLAMAARTAASYCEYARRA